VSQPGDPGTECNSFNFSGLCRQSERQLAACCPPVGELGRGSGEHLVLIGHCLYLVFILVCDIMSFFPPPFLLPFLPQSFFFSSSEFTSLAGMHIWSLSSPTSSFFFPSG